MTSTKEEKRYTLKIPNLYLTLLKGPESQELIKWQATISIFGTKRELAKVYAESERKAIGRVGYKFYQILFSQKTIEEVREKLLVKDDFLNRDREEGYADEGNLEISNLQIELCENTQNSIPWEASISNSKTNKVLVKVCDESERAAVGGVGYRLYSTFFHEKTLQELRDKLSLTENHH